MPSGAMMNRVAAAASGTGFTSTEWSRFKVHRRCLGADFADKFLAQFLDFLTSCRQRSDVCFLSRNQNAKGSRVIEDVLQKLIWFKAFLHFGGGPRVLK